jgi:hypothetical protein
VKKKIDLIVGKKNPASPRSGNATSKYLSGIEKK